MNFSRLIAFALAASLAQSALAHTELTETVPVDKSTVAAAPEKLELKFTEPVRLTALTIQNGAAAKRDLGPLPSGTSATFAVEVPAGLGEGQDVVTWRALSEDTHVMSGEFVFSVGAADPAARAGQAAAPVEQPHGTHDAAR